MSSGVMLATTKSISSSCGEVGAGSGDAARGGVGVDGGVGLFGGGFGLAGAACVLPEGEAPDTNPGQEHKLQRRPMCATGAWPHWAHSVKRRLRSSLATSRRIVAERLEHERNDVRPTDATTESLLLSVDSRADPGQPSGMSVPRFRLSRACAAAPRFRWHGG